MFSRILNWALLCSTLTGASVNSFHSGRVIHPTPLHSIDTQTGDPFAMLAGYQLAYIWTDDYGSRQKEVVGFCPDGTFYLYENSMSSYSDGNSGSSAAIGSSNAMVGEWNFEQIDGKYWLTLSAEGESGQAEVGLYTDEYGDQRFVIDGRAYGYYGEAICN